jgi:hypothetical protein
MENFLINWKRYLYAIWLSGSLGVCYNANPFDLRFWLVVLPTAAFVMVFNNNRIEEQ